MNILFVNTTCGIGSHGRICGELAEKYEKEGNRCIIAYGRGCSDKCSRFGHRIGGNLNIYEDVLKTRLFDNHGLNSYHATKEFLKWADSFNPDLLWLHNIHGYYINYELLFNWIKTKSNLKVKWTLHDCWAFTGHCAFFSMAKCEKWKNECNSCPLKKDYPGSLVLDRSTKNYYQKKKAFTGVNDLTLITPSQWLADLVRESFLRDYPVEVRYNTIDTNIFKPTASDFRKRFGLENKIVILGVANVWHKRKGLDDFIELTKMLDDRFVVVLVGLTNKQIKQLPPEILGLNKTNNPGELAQIYTAADVYLNPSKEETFGMTTIEAESCGTPAIVYQQTACEEIVKKTAGIAVPQDVKCLYHEIMKRYPMRAEHI